MTTTPYPKASERPSLAPALGDYVKALTVQTESVLVIVSRSDTSTGHRPRLFNPGLTVLNTGFCPVWKEGREGERERAEWKEGGSGGRKEGSGKGGRKEVLSGPLRLSMLSLASL